MPSRDEHNYDLFHDLSGDIEMEIYEFWVSVVAGTITVYLFIFVTIRALPLILLKILDRIRKGLERLIVRMGYRLKVGQKAKIENLRFRLKELDKIIEGSDNK